MPFISPKDEPFLVTHSLPRSPSVIRGEQIGRQPDQVDMAIGRDHVVFHFLSSERARR
jgi:hypothetical protein